jgi:Na+-driven multidrug efflux pump
MGVVWEVCLASTEGLGEAASVRLSFLLGEGFPAEAKLLASKVAFLACIEAMVVTSVLLVAGPNIAAALTTDIVLENILNNLMGLTSLANVAMTFAQVYWSLAGAQGSYGAASATILLSRWIVTIPTWL